VQPDFNDVIMSAQKTRSTATKTIRYPIPISAARSRIMSAIRAKGNRSTEARMASVLRSAKLKGWRRHVTIYGTPDFIWPGKKVALFVDGCFWHGCPKCYKPPGHNKTFWRQKVEGNRRRDQRVSSRLRRSGWRVLRVWECQVGSRRTLNRISKAL
jgi:DNA mismatch endonuclease, patch repair protein